MLCRSREALKYEYSWKAYIQNQVGEKRKYRN